MRALAERSPGEPTTAYADTQGTLLARIAVASLPMGVAAGDVPSGFRLLPRGEFAFDARVALVQLAERSIDLQYYHWQPDHVGRALLRALRDAAARGVRVRLLLDDYHAAALDDLLLDLGAHDHLQVRLFNPLALRKGAPTARLLLSPGDFELHNHRMHNKLLVADNALAVFGGRNIGDAYFMSHPDYNFVDLDVLAAGAVVRQLSTASMPTGTVNWPGRCRTCSARRPLPTRHASASAPRCAMPLRRSRWTRRTLLARPR